MSPKQEKQLGRTGTVIHSGGSTDYVPPNKKSRTSLDPSGKINPLPEGEVKEEQVFKARKFSWRHHHDVALLEEILFRRPYAQGHGSVAKKWETIAEALNNGGLGFGGVTGTACTKRFAETLLKRHKEDTWKSLRASGVEEEVTHLKESEMSDSEESPKPVTKDVKKERRSPAMVDKLEIFLDLKTAELQRNQEISKLDANFALQGHFLPLIARRSFCNILAPC